MYLVFAVLTFLLTIATILGFFSAIVTTPNVEWPTVLLIMVILVPFLAHKIYRLIIEYMDLDFLYIGHDITPEEVRPWKKMALKLWMGLIIFGVLAGAALTGFILTGGPLFTESVLEQGRRVEADRAILDIIISYSCYVVGILLLALVFGYLGVILRGWYFSTHTTSRFFNTLAGIKRFFLGLFGRVTGIKIRREEDI